RRDALMRKVVGRVVGLGSADVLRCGVRVVLEDALNAVAGSETAQNMLYRDARPGDHGLPHHNLRIAFDAWVQHGLTSMGGVSRCCRAHRSRKSAGARWYAAVALMAARPAAVTR